MTRKPLPVLTGNARRARQEQTIQDPILVDACRELRKAGFREVAPEPGSLAALAIEAHARRRAVEIVPEAKPSSALADDARRAAYILRREQRQAFANCVNGGPR